MRRALIGLAAVLSVLTISGCGGGGKVSDAYDRCFGGDSALTHRVVEKGDGGNSLIITLGEEPDPDSIEGVKCIFNALEISDALREDIGSTTSMMGRQTEKDKGLTFRWSYHPDNGMDMTITE